jgi:hypothetical protein
MAEHRSPSRHLIARSSRGGPRSNFACTGTSPGWEERGQAIVQAADKAGSNLDRDGGADQGLRGEPLLSGRR